MGKTQLRALIIVFVLGLGAIGSYYYSIRGASKQEDVSSFLDIVAKNGLDEFSAEDIAGHPVELQMLRDKVVVVNFWASWCGPCVEEIPSLAAMARDMGEKVALVAISGDDSLDEMKRFLKAYPEFNQRNIYVVWKDHKNLMARFQVDRLPESYIFDSKLKLRKKVSGSIQWNSTDALEYLQQLIVK